VEVAEGMVFIPAGEFVMGLGNAPPNGPEHKVWLDGYAIGKYAVTNAEWQRFADATGFRPLPASWREGEIPPAGENHPVMGVTWEDAHRYCSWVSKATGRGVRLPTEAEWEKAARGEKGQLHTWGNEPGPAVRPAATDLTGGSTSPVGAVPHDKSPSGCYDMGGNGFEWCEDWFQFDYYLKSPYKNPRGPTESEVWEAGDRGMGALARVLRGGSWANYAEGREVAQRNAVPPATRHLDFGFRIACDVSPR
jgi:formylglycine-generating enzyme required for sulfatase activity